jgi:hypothetical protein
MALQHLRSSTADKRPTPAAMSDGQLALNTNLASPGLFFKDSNGDSVKIGPVHVGTTAPNVTPGAGGQAGNSKGEAWLDTTAANPILKVWNGSAFVAVQPVGTGTVVSTADTGTVTSTMILDGTILNADVNASAAIAGTKISPDFGSQTIASTGVFSHALGAAATPSITFTGDLNTGIYSPGADQLAISTGGSGKLFIDSAGVITTDNGFASGRLNVVNTNTVATFDRMLLLRSSNLSNAFLGLGSDSFYVASASNAPIVFCTDSDGGTSGSSVPTNERLRITSAGLVGIGTSAPGYPLDLQSESGGAGLRIRGGSGGSSVIQFTDNAISSQWGAITTAPTSCNIEHSAIVRFGTASTERMRIDSSGLVGIGTTSPQALLQLEKNVVGEMGAFIYNPNAGGYGAVRIGNADRGTNGDHLIYGGGELGFISKTGAPIAFFPNGGSEKARIDTSGRLLVGTSSSVAGAFSDQALFQTVKTDGSAGYTNWRFTNDAGGPIIYLNKSRSGTAGVNTIVQNGDTVGNITFAGADGTTYHRAAAIIAEVDGTPGANDMPGRLVFSTTADGASSPTERMRITSGGAVLVGTTDTTLFDNTSGSGIVLDSVGAVQIARSAEAGLFVNRMTDDGVLVAFYQAGTFEGDISVSGTTVSYNGAHLSRWSQLPAGAERKEILRGSVLSNIDEMCEWGDEDNEQLNRMKVSDVEGDKNVSGVFQAWDDDDDTYTNDFYCAMTGDFIIRIAAGTTVERGDLLMSAGDGTAKPQDDDIIRSKTIAKVTSTNVSCTYPDGSYCVPCVLMAC